MLIDEINKAKVVAFKNKDEQAKNAIGNVKSKFLLMQCEKRAKGEEMTDADTVQILLKISKELDEEFENYKKVNNTVEMENLQKQKATIESFLPKMMSIEEIKQVILSLPDKTVPTVMKHFKANYAGKVNMKDVNLALKEL
ncbi:MAG: GatB/YqeY domain-containing protein [Clostridia bacterium]|nr:GatB/YqeY domain-containing protein [Clostridia bacterium]